jgi:hypothetical protein
MHIGYWWESHKERDHWEDQDVGGWKILTWTLDKMGCMDLIDLAQDRDQCMALVNTVMKIRFAQIVKHFFSSWIIDGFSRRAKKL